MKKRHVGLLALLAGQAISTYAKDKAARDELMETPGIAGKLKKVGQKLRDSNKKTVEQLKKADRDSAAEMLKKDANHDAKAAQARIDENKDADRAVKGQEVVRTIIDKAPDQKTLAQEAEKYTTRIKTRWNNL